MKIPFAFIYLFFILTLFSTFGSCDDVHSQELTPKQRKVINIIVSTIFLILGPVFIILGCRFYKPILTVTGFVFFFALVYLLLYEYTTLKWWICLIIAIVMGFAIGLFLYHFHVVGFFIVGCAMGAVIGLIILSTPIGTKYLNNSKVGQGLIVGLAGLFVGIIAVLLQKVVFVISTSIIGSYMCIVALDVLWVKTGVIANILINLIRKKPELIVIDGKVVYILLGAIGLLTAIGIVIQLAFTARKIHFGKRRDGYIQVESY